MLNYRLGLPAWAYAGWENIYFDPGGERLRQYASVFSSVEGNTTFYAIPSSATVQDWCRQLEGLDFRPCFKLPREVTHEPGGEEQLSEFLSVMEPLFPKLGPFLLQFPAGVGPNDIGHIKAIVEALPTGLDAALEVRHPDFFADEASWDQHLSPLGCLRAMMDARPIHRHDSTHPEIANARHEKPDLPVYTDTSARGLLVRVVFHPVDAINVPYFASWVTQTATWLNEGRDVYMMIHCPNNQHCPRQALDFHEQLRREVPGLPALPDWPVSQQSLF